MKKAAQKKKIHQLAAVLLLGSFVSKAETIQPVNRSQFLRNAKWGVFITYLAGLDVTPEEWNRRIDNFDVNGLAKQLHDVGSGYLMITIGQNSGHFLSPNKTYDSIVGQNPSKCSRRDLIADLYTALSPYGIKLLVYLPSGAPDSDPIAIKKLQWTKGPNRNLAFQRNWERIITEWSTRWGTKVSGWWFDGCYWPNAMYRQPTGPGFKSFAAAARAGNPQSIVSFNRGKAAEFYPESPEEDYTAGETNDPRNVRVSEPIVDGAQWHMMSYLGQSWGAAPLRFDDSEVIRITTGIVQKGGVVSWDVPHGPTGLFDDTCLRQLHAIGLAAWQLK